MIARTRTKSTTSHSYTRNLILLSSDIIMMKTINNAELQCDNF